MTTTVETNDIEPNDIEAVPGDVSVTFSDATEAPVPFWRSGKGKLLMALGPFAVLQFISRFLPDIFPNSLFLLPDSVAVDPATHLNTVTDWMTDDEIFGLFTIRDVTRAIFGLIQWPLDLFEGILLDGIGPLPGIPWVMFVGLLATLGWYLKDAKLALLIGSCAAYFALFGSFLRWELSMKTLAAVLVAAPIAAIMGGALGIIAAKKRWFEAILVPLLNVMQALPHFTYLLPVAIFIGVSQKAGVVATIFFAFPPMARLAILGLRGIPDEVIEAGVMSGATPRQMLWKVEIPSAREKLMMGVNQVIMGCLGMVVIAAFVGTQGLGQDLRIRLQRIEIGQALEVGIAIVLMAVMLDRLSQAAAVKQPEHKTEQVWWKAYRFMVAAAVVVVVSSVLALISDTFHVYPEKWSLKIFEPVDRFVDWMQSWNFLDAFRDFMLLEILIPLKEAFLAVPWFGAVVLFAGIGFVIGGWRLAVTVAGFVTAIAFTGFWVETMNTAYFVFAGLCISVAIGVPMGIWASKNKFRGNVAQIFLDTFQTLPSFLYLLPAIMLFRVSPVSVLFAILIYPVVPAVRYTMAGINNVPEDLIEAARTSGCTERQLLWKVKIPLAIPEILLGINQTLMFTLFMVVIGAFIVSTGGLGDVLIRAITDQDIGKGVIAGLCVAGIGLTVDKLITSWAHARKEQLGLL